MKSGVWWFMFVIMFGCWEGGLASETTTAIMVSSSKNRPDLPVSQGALPASSNSPSSTKPFSTINSDVLDFDYDKRIATFEGNVVAVDPKLTLKCKTMKVFFAKKEDEVIRVEAYTDVRMYHENKEAFGEKAVFTRETDLLVLSGGDCRLKDEKGNWIRSRGAGIIYNIRTKQMHVDKPTLEILPDKDRDLLKPSAPK